MFPIRRNDLPALAWDDFVLRSTDGWFFHTEAWIEYSLAYTPGSTDSSHAFATDNGNVSGVWPTVLGASGVTLVNGGQEPVAPIGDCAGKAIGGYSHRPRRKTDVDTGSRETFVVDLTQPPKELWRQLRGSYKPLINRASRELTLETASNRSHDSIKSDLVMSAALAIHTEASGRQTRSDRTWQLQSQWLSDGRATCVLASRNGTAIAFAYALTWKGWAYYFSSASLEDDVLHALVWELMMASAASGCRYFELGHVAHDGDSDKEKGISFFKSGFGGDVWEIPRG